MCRGHQNENLYFAFSQICLPNLEENVKKDPSGQKCLWEARSSYSPKDKKPQDRSSTVADFDISAIKQSTHGNPEWVSLMVSPTSPSETLVEAPEQWGGADSRAPGHTHWGWAVGLAVGPSSPQGSEGVWPCPEIWEPPRGVMETRTLWLQLSLAMVGALW